MTKINELIVKLERIIETAIFKHKEDKDIIRNAIWNLKNQESLLEHVKKGTIK